MKPITPIANRIAGPLPLTANRINRTAERLTSAGLVCAPAASTRNKIAVRLLASAVPVHGAVFNVRDYGAMGDVKTDNTTAFSACLNAGIAAGGGRMYLPDGVYRGRIIIPAVSKPLPSWITVEIVGESEPAPVFGTIVPDATSIPPRQARIPIT